MIHAVNFDLVLLQLLTLTRLGLIHAALLIVGSAESIADQVQKKIYLTVLLMKIILVIITMKIAGLD